MVRRPLLYVAVSFAVSVVFSYYLDSAVTFAAGIALLLIKSRQSGEKTKIIFLIAAGCIAGSVNFAYQETSASVLMQKAGTPAELRASVVQTETKESSTGWGEKSTYVQIKAEVYEVNGIHLDKKERILLKYYEKIGAVPGDTITVRGNIELPDGKRNPGCFDYRLYLESIGIRTVMTAETMECEKNDSLQGKLHIFREKFIDDLTEVSGEAAAGLMRALLFGGKTELDETTLEEFQKNGTAHVLAVSGLHVGIIYGFISKLWRWKKKLLYFLMLAVFFSCYMVMASFSPSVVRAVVMIGLHVFADITGRRYDLSSAAFFTALLMMTVNPMQVFNAGFQMSFLAVLTLSLLIPVVRKIYSGVFLGSIAVQAGLLPYTVYTFNYFSSVAVFINVPVIFLTGIIVPAGLCSAFFFVFCEPLFKLTGGVLAGLCTILTEFNSLTCIDGITVFSVAGPYLWMIAVYYLSLLFFVSEEGRLMVMRKHRKSAAAMIAAVVAMTLAFNCMTGTEFRKAELIFVDVGQGDCMHLRTENGEYLIDGGGSIGYNVGKKTLKPYLLKNGTAEISGAFVTHLHTDHYRGITELCIEGMVGKLFVYDGNRVRENEILEETGLASEDIVYLSAGQRVRLDDETLVTVLWPDKKTWHEYEKMAEDEADENESSLILKIEMGGYSMIATGDVDAECLDRLAGIWGSELDADILKVPHHGSKYSWSSDFTEAVSPAYAVFQVGKNNFGHPNQGVVENYLGNDIMIYRNDEDGAVGFDFTKNGAVEIMTVRGENSGWLQELIRNRNMHL